MKIFLPYRHWRGPIVPSRRGYLQSGFGNKEVVGRGGGSGWHLKGMPPRGSLMYYKDQSPHSAQPGLRIPALVCWLFLPVWVLPTTVTHKSTVSEPCSSNGFFLALMGGSFLL